MDGETEEFYGWLTTQAEALGWVQPERDRELHPRQKALAAAAWMVGSESNEVGAQPAFQMCAHEFFTILRDTWAAGFKAGTGTT